MFRTIIEINEKLCTGCELCVTACHEGAIGMKNGKAVLLRDDYCDGLGDCLPSCPTNAISFVEREALPYNEEEVLRNIAKKAKSESVPEFQGCPGTLQRTIKKENQSTPAVKNIPGQSELNSWPIQLKLVNPQAGFFQDSHLLIAADCSAFTYCNFHRDFIKNKICVISCPKLDEGDYTDKITQILDNNNIKSITIVRMEVPCCGGLSNAGINALKNIDKMIPLNIVTISLDGKILDI